MYQRLKKVKAVFILFILLLFVFEILTNSKEIMDSVVFSFEIWIKNIFPSLFPMFVLAGILINYGLPEILSEVLKPLMRLFNSNSNCAFILAMSIISGFPSSAKYVKELYDKGMIDKQDAEKVLTYTHFSNPLFILGTVGLLLNNKKAALIILLVHYSTNIIIGLFFRNYHPKEINEYKVNVKKISKALNNSKDVKLGNVLSSSISSAVDTLLLILGSVTTFLVISSVINNFIPMNIPILNGILEMTQGIKLVSSSDIPFQLKTTLMTFFLSFGGLSVHMQIKSILSDTNISLKPFFLARIIHAILASIFVSLFL